MRRSNTMYNKHVLTLDADTKEKAIKIAEKISNYYGPEMRRSSSGTGWHFRIKSVITTGRQNITLREKLGDCKGRLNADKIRIKLKQPINVLFEWKSGKKAGEWEPLDMAKILEQGG